MTTKKERIKRLVKHLAFKIFTFAIILGIASYVINFPGFTNEMAMAQFENDNYVTLVKCSSGLSFRKLNILKC